MMKQVSIIIPLFNEETSIGALHAVLKTIIGQINTTYKVELILVNDGSTDNTSEKLKMIEFLTCEVRVINFSRNFGHQAALKAGYDHCTGEAIICLDGDLQNPPELIIKMLDLWESRYDIVICRRKGAKQNSGYLKDISSRIFYKMMSSISEVEIESNAPDFRLIDRKVLTELLKFKERELFFRGIISWVGFKKIVLEYDHVKREHGKSSYHFLKMMRLALVGVTAFSTKPLYLSFVLGFIIIILDLLYIIYALFVHYNGETISGWTSLIIAIMFFGGIQLFFLGVLGLYIARIFIQVKERPYYIVESYN